MEFQKCEVAGAWLIRPNAREDSRGRFMRAWCQRELDEQGICFLPVQANMSLSVARGTIRGLHYQQAPSLEAKLVRCTRGSIFDVVVDLRTDSPTYRTWYGAELTADNGHMMFVPEGCAHGCQTLEDRSELYYLTSAFYSPSDVRGLRYDDSAFGIRWPLPVSAVSDQDRGWPDYQPASNGGQR
jgi:dTDP-4-dehydrorhamnose 3,5-epimerase